MRCREVSRFISRDAAEQEAAAMRARGIVTRLRSKRAAISVFRSGGAGRPISQEDVSRVYVLYRCSGRVKRRK